MYPNFEHVLKNAKNVRILFEAVKELGIANKIMFDDHDINIAVENELKRAIEEKIMGTRYLTSGEALYGANQFMVTRAFKELQEIYASRPKESEPEETIIESKRREITTNREIEYSYEKPKDEEKATPRNMLR